MGKEADGHWAYRLPDRLIGKEADAEEADEWDCLVRVLMNLKTDGRGRYYTRKLTTEKDL